MDEKILTEALLKLTAGAGLGSQAFSSLLLKQACAISGARSGSLYLREGDTLKIFTAWFGETGATRHAVPFGHSIADWAARNSAPIRVSDESATSGRERAGQIALPLAGPGGAFGAFALEGFPGRAFSVGDERNLSVFAAFAGAMLSATREIEALKSERNMLVDILGESPNGIIALDRERRVAMMNHAARRYTGTRDTLESVCGSPVARYLPQKPFLAALERVFAGSELETVEIEGGMVPDVRNYSLKIFRPGSGEWIGATVLIHDQTEQRKLDAEVQRMDRVASIGQLAAGIAHEIRNPLTGIAITLDILREQEKLSEAGAEMLGDISREIDRLEALIKGILDYARPQPASRRPMRVAKALEWQRSFIEQCRSKGVSCEVDLEVNPKIEGDPERLKQLFLNLAINALDATERGGSIVIRSSVEISERQGERVRVTISDTGRGMDKQTAGRVFDPFFTTKNEGTGLGLSIAHSIVEQHGGQIEVATTPGKGTTFAVTLPLHEEADG